MKIILKHGQKSIDLTEDLTIRFTAHNDMLTVYHRNGNQFPVYFKSVEINSESVIIEVMGETDLTLLHIFISKNK